MRWPFLLLWMVFPDSDGPITNAETYISCRDVHNFSRNLLFNSIAALILEQAGYISMKRSDDVDVMRGVFGYH
ncbi:uncharacterized protein K489DRAFT_36973 [Dissoconium aciculare CBS 342.82]|uniref:Uncharacterized protein n=1 Tax=Dissoconium aciculare CBS 342.82 TaxID=1314786 RepID=A0A6J3LXV6_9PEZI|nr:uncharacterized protein K489DRAFT_36973 [Dissoconium aciculare CBS 342.82]KAF1820590.1 hypothetical protein K489DRAFT_36973 [Dissoconium aciculare CBS 342.82]